MPLTKEELIARRKAQWAVGAVIGNAVAIFLTTFGAALQWGAGAALLVAGIGVFVVSVLLGLNN